MVCRCCVGTASLRNLRLGHRLNMLAVGVVGSWIELVSIIILPLTFRK
jgi:hypothetical protein